MHTVLQINIKIQQKIAVIIILPIRYITQAHSGHITIYE